MATEEAQRPASSRASEISRELVKLYSRTIGRGPTKAKTIVNTNVIVAVFEETLTQSERTLASSGGSPEVASSRYALGEAAREEAVGIVEAATDRTVRSYMAAVDVGSNAASLTFLLEPIPETGDVDIVEIAPADGDGNGRPA